MKPDAVARLLRKDLTPGDVHVPVPGNAPKPKKRRRVADIFRQYAKADPGLYVGRQLTPVCDARLRAWWAGLSTVPLDPNLHVTVAYSRVSIPWVANREPVIVPPSQFLGFHTLGKDSAQVLRFRSPELQAGWQQALSRGATWDHPSYSPHLTFFYTPFNLKGVPLPPFALEFGPEEFGPRSHDIFKWDTMGGSVDGFLRAQDCEEGLAEAVHASWMSHQRPSGDPHYVVYSELDERAKQVDRDAVRAVLAGVMALGYSFTKTP